MTKDTNTMFDGSNLHNIFHTSENLEEDGAWVTVNDILGMKIKVRRMNADAVVKAQEKIVRDYFSEENNRDLSKLSDSDSETLLILQMAEAVLIDWKGIKDKNKTLIPYSKEAAVEFLKMKDFREFTYKAANDRETFRSQHDADAEKNS